MKKRDTDMIFILDRSGSMSCVEEDTIKEYNDFLKKERKNSGNVYVTTVLFDDCYEILYSREKIGNVRKLTKDKYYARGCTALLDAVGKTISGMSKKINDGNRVVVIIMTDGLENASLEYDKNKVKRLIKKHSKWEFVFLGANIDSYAEGTSLGISSKRIANFHQDKGAMGNIFKCASMLCENVEFDLQREINK